MLPQTIAWKGSPETGCCTIIDQTLLPNDLSLLDLFEFEALCRAIKELSVRGAPAIGIAAGFGLWLGMRECEESDPALWLKRAEAVKTTLDAVRPTAVNLSWASGRALEAAARAKAGGVPLMREALFAEAEAILEEDRAICRRLGQVGASLIADGARLLTHCNAGGLATSERGTALAPMFEAKDQGKSLHVFADETRPLLQGARLTAYELIAAGIPVTVLCDNAAAALLTSGRIDAIFVGADRIARNGDTCNKIGTLGLALLAQATGVPFYVVAPRSTFDLSLEHGGLIPIEERAAEEVSAPFGQNVVAEGAAVWNPAFDVTPARLIRGIVTERGLIRPVDAKAIAKLFTEDAEGHRAAAGSSR